MLLCLYNFKPDDCFLYLPHCLPRLCIHIYLTSLYNLARSSLTLHPHSVCPTPLYLLLGNYILLHLSSILPSSFFYCGLLCVTYHPCSQMYVTAGCQHSVMHTSHLPNPCLCKQHQDDIKKIFSCTQPSLPSSSLPPQWECRLPHLTITT